MKRRKFFKHMTSGLMGLGMAGGLSLSAIADPSEQPTSSFARESSLTLKKGIKLHLFDEDLSLPEKFRLLKEMGFKGVEVRSPKEDRSRDDVLKAKEETGLEIHGVLNAGNWSQPFSSPDPKVRAKGIETLKSALSHAAAYGASTVLLVPAVVTDEVSYDAAWHRSQETIRKVLPVAEEHGVTIALENVWNRFLLSPMEFARYIDELESDYVGAYLDIGNVLTYGWPEQWLRILGDRVVKVDLKDRNRDRFDGRGQAVRVKLGGGSCDWEEVQTALSDIGYSGWATAEVSGGDRGRLREISQRMSQVLPFS